jgi:hypothetical protein
MRSAVTARASELETRPRSGRGRNCTTATRIPATAAGNARTFAFSAPCVPDLQNASVTNAAPIKTRPATKPGPRSCHHARFHLAMSRSIPGLVNRRSGIRGQRNPNPDPGREYCNAGVANRVVDRTYSTALPLLGSKPRAHLWETSPQQSHRPFRRAKLL